MSKSLKETFSEASIRLLSEEKKKNLTYEYKAHKHGEALPLGDKDITRVEVLLTDKNLPGKVATVATNAAVSIKKLNKQVEVALEQLTKEKAVLKPLFTELFAEGDAVLSRVIKTAAVTIVYTKTSETSKVNYKKFMELVYENFKDSTALIDKLTKKCTEIGETAASIRIEMNESQINENVITKIFGKLVSVIKNMVDSFIKEVKAVLKQLDIRLSKLNSLLSTDEKAEVDKQLATFDFITESVVNESVIYDTEKMNTLFHEAVGAPITKQVQALIDYINEINPDKPIKDIGAFMNLLQYNNLDGVLLELGL
jgi:hypothetical protein